MATRYGSRLMPVVVDEIAKQQPDLVYASVPLTTNVSEGFKDITFFDIASATNHVAAWIDHRLGRSPNFDTIAYMGLGDMRYVVVFLAAVKCGYKVLLPSLRNSPWMNASLLEQTKCSHLLYAPEVETLVRPLIDHRRDLQLHPIQSLETLVQPNTPHYPYEKSYEEAKGDPILILHSSGSTGPPRPIYMNHATFAVGDNDRNLPTVPGRVNQNWSLWEFPGKQREYFFSPFPAFHLAGFSSMVMLPIYYNATLVLNPPTRPPTGHLVSEIMDHFKLKSIFCPPIIAEQLVQEAGGLEKCKSLKFLLYAGGPLSQTAGDALSKVTDVCQFYGQTETGPIQALVPKREDWASLEWHPMQEAIMEPSIDGTFEMIMHRNPALEGVRSLSCNFPDVKVWRTKDLFKPHPTKHGLWRFHGRTDDIIVLSNGEKFNPVPSETQIAAHPLIAGALIIGNGRAQASLILEPKDYSQDFIDQVWPVVEQANSEAPGHARITKDMILIGSEDKPFERSPKGTVIRNATGAKYEKEIADLYSRDISRNLQHIKLGLSHDLTSTTRFVKEVVVSAFPGHSFGEEDDLFALGLDSLQTTEIISLLKSGINSDENQQDVTWITAKFVYEHPSIRTLSEAIRDYLASADGTLPIGEPLPHNREERMQRMIQKYAYATGEPETSHNVSEQQSGLHVLLTGSTGSLGRQILVKLASDSRVTKISCLDRSANASERVRQSVSTWPQPPVLDPSRVFFHQADYSKADFGLEKATFAELRDTTNVIIHNAWKVDFNHSLSSFEAVHIRSIHNFIHFSASSKLHPRIVFISSISSVGNWHSAVPASEQSGAKNKIVPETIAPLPTVAQPIGYAESKAVAEQLLAAAARSGYINASIIRIGQIAGPIGEDNGGKWNEHEWFPLLLKTSKALGKIPDASMLDKIDWVPIDIIASVILDLSLLQNQQTLQVYHLVNPSPKTWSELLPAIQAYIGNAEAVSMQEWVSKLEKVDTNDSDAVVAKPAVKILDFFRDMQSSKYIGANDVEFSTKNAEAASSKLKQLGPVRAEWIRRWMKDWGF
ncbi:NRPS-like enzyme [Periconia macrospinosa]|uniref:NRPS-like enzyme n=1 Tax=Periconia macrospinosa TaxID=97972 RepID=A0A2V1D1G4_9PLEO|nr:NRPS-like enzyme [Periconia macrospinosa]